MLFVCFKPVFVTNLLSQKHQQEECPDFCTENTHSKFGEPKPNKFLQNVKLCFCFALHFPHSFVPLFTNRVAFISPRIFSFEVECRNFGSRLFLWRRSKDQKKPDLVCGSTLDNVATPANRLHLSTVAFDLQKTFQPWLQTVCGSTGHARPSLRTGRTAKNDTCEQQISVGLLLLPHDTRTRFVRF